MSASTTRSETGPGEYTAGESVTLRIVSGVHAGASLTLASGDMVMIGAGEDCEVILSDPDIAKHHCLVSLTSGRVAVRPVDAAITLSDGTTHQAGEVLWISPGIEVSLGGAAFEVTADSSSGIFRGIPKVRVVRRPRSDAAARWHRRLRWAVAAAVVTAVACRLVPGARESQPTHANISHDKTMTVMQAPTGVAVAHDVTEVLRLSGIPCDAHYDGNGVVTVRGHFGDPHAVRSIVLSRAMHEIEGLKRVLVLNLDQPGTPAVEPEPPGGRIVTAVSGRDPYVTTADGSRYYVGAALPERGRLSGVADGEVLIERDGKIEHLKLPDTVPGSAQADAASTGGRCEMGEPEPNCHGRSVM